MENGPLIWVNYKISLYFTLICIKVGMIPGFDCQASRDGMQQLPQHRRPDLGPDCRPGLHQVNRHVRDQVDQMRAGNFQLMI